ncbi:HlyD family efflux transporter periplasmic adaptor subunit [Salipiger sp. P9]|uniref:efflux RND transporter periplasmic adaptor subunit n=1 Tax=Salipiger pentaromativorans TaxID=2943193 RepID=UPI00215810C9|nr:HlyD family efflux transporter periplasmic adaptor subunit [Salipiger pentaromativorans]MCR8548187.1 HlyD family efflux transporter periplasmic adaptor subunit [Salipiger pentaromativorans]
MADPRNRTRLLLWSLAALLLGGALVVAFWPRATLVDLGTVTRGPLTVTIDEEGRTQVHDVYVVSTPVAGRLLRVRALAGDTVAQGETVAHMRPTNPDALDIRTREQASAAVDAARAALKVAEAEVNVAAADADLAQSEYERNQTLAKRGTVSAATLDRSRSETRAAAARLETAKAAVSMREAELANARAQLISFDDLGLAAAVAGDHASDISLVAPVSGRILQVLQQSETILTAGTAVLEIGDIAHDLEIEVDLISSDAVQVRLGDRVMIDDWGGDSLLDGEVARIAPLGETKVSALGVEEQRVGVTIRFTGPVAERAALGHGYRVVTRIVTWDAEDTLRIPQSALFRSGDGWAAFRMQDGRAVQVPVELGPGNGTMAQVLSGLAEGDSVVLYPTADLSDGARIATRSVE